jgi:hypothetical protein
MAQASMTTTYMVRPRELREFVFADTFYWIALTNPRDSAHRRVMEFTTTLPQQSVITTDEVLTEFLAYCAFNRQLRREAGIGVMQLLYVSMSFRIAKYNVKCFRPNRCAGHSLQIIPGSDRCLLPR